jgi:hypothetical protein
MSRAVKLDSRSLAQFAACLVTLLAGCSATPRPPVAVSQNGWTIYNGSNRTQTIPCSDHAVLLRGNHTDTRLTGSCRYVWVAGYHNDIDVAVAPGGTIEITGKHNDVSWRQAAPGQAPILKAGNEDNTFHSDWGWERYRASRVTDTIHCADAPILLEGNRDDLQITGECHHLRVAGEHNDIAIDVAPSATIEITGEHNDVTWRQVAPGPGPTLEDLGVSNDFHQG